MLTDGLINIFIFIGTGISLFYIILFFRYYLNNKIKKNGLNFTWRNAASAANPPSQTIINGHIYTPIEVIKKKSLENKNKKGSLYLNNFRFFQDYINETWIPSFFRKRYENVKYYLDSSKLCRTMLIVGSAGSGKTEQILSLINQDWYDKAIVFSKKFDFEPIFFMNSHVHSIVQPKLKAGSIHNILDEDIQYIETFTESLVQAMLGGKDKNDFFSSSARQQLQKYMETVKLEGNKKNLSVKEKWQLLLDIYEKAYIDAQSGEQKSLRDVMATVKIIMNPVYIMAYRIIEDNAKTFTAKDFFNKKTPSKIFLSANDPSMEGIVAATYAVLTKYQLNLPNEWSEKPVLHLQDEYNSLKELMPERLLIEQREVGRSKMFATIIGVQDLKADKNISQNLLTNVQYLSIFGGTDTNTLNQISEIVGEIEYENYKTNESVSPTGKSVSYSIQKEKKKVIDNYHMNILQDEDFSHLFISLKEKLIFKGYTPQVNLEERTYLNLLEEIDLNKYYEWKHERENKIENIKKATTEAAEAIVSDIAV